MKTLKKVNTNWFENLFEIILIKLKFFLINFKERDAFDTLFEHAPDKLVLVKNSLLTFTRKHLNKLEIEINDLDNNQLADGVNLILLMGILENYFVPEYAYYPTATGLEQKLANCKLLFELIDDACLQRPNCNPEGKK